jgi:hypothetical protein
MTYLTRREAAQYLKLKYRRGSYPWLSRLAADGLGPRHHRFGRAVLYSQTDLDDWAAQNIRVADIQPDLFEWADREKAEPAPQPTYSVDAPVTDRDAALRAAFRVINAIP